MRSLSSPTLSSNNAKLDFSAKYLGYWSFILKLFIVFTNLIKLLYLLLYLDIFYLFIDPHMESRIQYQWNSYY
jgi:hypothetical protein